MIRNQYAAILGIVSFFVLSISSQAQAQSTGQLTLSMLTHFKKVYSAAATATDKAAAEKAVATIKNELKQVETIAPLLAKSSKPTAAEMATVAEATAKMEIEMNKLIQTMAGNLKNKDVRAILSPTMKQFSTKASSARATMDKLYPAEKMRPLVKAARAKLLIQNTP